MMPAIWSYVLDNDLIKSNPLWWWLHVAVYTHACMNNLRVCWWSYLHATHEVTREIIIVQFKCTTHHNLGGWRCKGCLRRDPFHSICIWRIRQQAPSTQHHNYKEQWHFLYSIKAECAEFSGRSSRTRTLWSRTCNKRGRRRLKFTPSSRTYISETSVVYILTAMSK